MSGYIQLKRVPEFSTQIYKIGTLGHSIFWLESNEFDSTNSRAFTDYDYQNITKLNSLLIKVFCSTGPICLGDILHHDFIWSHFVWYDPTFGGR